MAMKIEARSLHTVRQTLANVRALLSVTLNESVSRPERRRTIKARIEDLSEAIRLIDEGLGAMPMREANVHAPNHEEATDG